MDNVDGAMIVIKRRRELNKRYFTPYKMKVKIFKYTRRENILFNPTRIKQVIII